MLVDGKWADDWQPVQEKDEDGRFVRQTSSFRSWITPDGAAGPTGDAGFRAEAGRYHLYAALICPWACRALAVRSLKGLKDIISVSIVDPRLTGQGWRFAGSAGAPSEVTEDHLLGSTYMHEIYTEADPHFSGRATVPVLWDKKTGTMVNNESADIIRMLGSAFDELTGNELNLYPASLQADIDELAEEIYEPLNNGVYKAGFATTQSAYEEAYETVFKTLDRLEGRLSDQGPFLMGKQLTEADIRLFVTLVRFDAAYFGLFKCNKKRIADYPQLSRFAEAVYNVPGISDTVNIEHIKLGYYSIKALNPNGIVPRGPDLAFLNGAPA